MITANEAGVIAEEAITQYVKRCGAHSPADLEKTLEMLISKAARGIEKYAGYQPSMDVLVRTLERIANAPAPVAGGH